MNSAVPKVLHTLAGLSLIGHVLRSAAAAGLRRPAVVVGPGMDDVSAEVLERSPGAAVHVQPEQRGTADALLAAREVLAGDRGDVMVIYGDTPLIRPETLQRLRSALDSGASIAVLGFIAEDPAGYGRLICDERGALFDIREEDEASGDERAIALCNGGAMAFRCPNLPALLGRIGTKTKGERYLTDAIALARADGLDAVVVRCQETEVMGVNSRRQLAAAEKVFQERARAKAMQDGATLIAPDTVWFSHDTAIGRDVCIEPNVFFGPGCVVEDGVEILANCHFVGAHLRTGARVGPFARMRPGSLVGPGAHVGNFVELKNTRMEQGAKANHLAYIGDSRIGAGANVGAGTIFCNYDGFNKHMTEIGAGAFIGSNASLVAPVVIGPGAYVGSGTVVTQDVPADALAIGRAEQQVRMDWAARFRSRRGRRKQEKPA